jgi:predicted TIM-barrel fold metal-dependent hydrolase
MILTNLSFLKFTISDGACDCHTHVYLDPANFPFAPQRRYTPEMALPRQMVAFHRMLGIQRAVIVTSSVYGTDNGAMVWGLEQYGPEARGVAVIGGQTSEAELDAMDRVGVRGIRLNFKVTSRAEDLATNFRQLQGAIDRLRHRPWHIEILTNLTTIVGLKDLIITSPIPIVFDHFGGARPELGVQQPGFAQLLDLLRSANIYVKLSITGGPRGDYRNFLPLAQALIAANPQRIVWGSNWPHPNSSSGRPVIEPTSPFPVDDGLVLNQLRHWAPDSGLRKAILLDNPARLYDFSGSFS